MIFAEAEAAGFLAAYGAILCVGLLFYFIPTFVAVMRGHPNTAAIVVVNLLLGWSLIGFAVALAWAFTAIEKDRPRRRYRDDDYDDRPRRRRRSGDDFDFD